MFALNKMSVGLTHVKKTMKEMAGEKKSMGKKWFSHVLKTAKKSYHKPKKGGGSEEEESVKMGGKKRRGGKTQRRQRK
jgi:hypothetical protein